MQLLIKPMHLNGALNANSCADAINNHGQIVGYFLSAGGKHAFIATFDSNNTVTLTDLNTLIPQNSGWELTEATGINDSGQIVGYGNFNDQVSAFILNPPAQSGICCRGAICDTTLTSSSACSAASNPAGLWSTLGAACNASGDYSSPCCSADYDKNNVVNVSDIFAFLRGWFAHSSFANANQTGSVDVSDIFAFLRSWFSTNGHCSTH